VMENYGVSAVRRISRLSGGHGQLPHETTDLAVSARTRERGISLTRLRAATGSLENDPSITLITGHADCMAFYCVDPLTRSNGLAHAGWRGALGRVGANVFASMREAFGARTKNIRFGRPSSARTVFRGGQNVAEHSRWRTRTRPACVRAREKKRIIDLGWSPSGSSGTRAAAENVSLFGVCTMKRRICIRTGGLGQHGRHGGLPADSIAIFNVESLSRIRDGLRLIRGRLLDKRLRREYNSTRFVYRFIRFPTHAEIA
jgi:hypothetical protein